MDKLKNCPFCGSEVDFKKTSVYFGPETIDGFEIVCSCGIKTVNQIYDYDGKIEDELKQKLTDIWNWRVNG